MVNYRKATIRDVDELAKIRSIFLMEANDVSSETERGKIEAINKAYFETALADDSFVAWLALDEDEIIATSGLSFSFVPPSFHFQDGKVAYIMNMFTFPAYRNQGVGTELFKRTIEEARTRGYKKITLGATNMGRPLYEKYGFRRDESSMVYYVV